MTSNRAKPSQDLSQGTVSLSIASGFFQFPFRVQFRGTVSVPDSSLNPYSPGCFPASDCPSVPPMSCPRFSWQWGQRAFLAQCFSCSLTSRFPFEWHLYWLMATTSYRSSLPSGYGTKAEVEFVKMHSTRRLDNETNSKSVEQEVDNTRNSPQLSTTHVATEPICQYDQPISHSKVRWSTISPLPRIGNIFHSKSNRALHQRYLRSLDCIYREENVRLPDRQTAPRQSSEGAGLLIAPSEAVDRARWLGVGYEQEYDIMMELRVRLYIQARESDVYTRKKHKPFYLVSRGTRKGNSATDLGGQKNAELGRIDPETANRSSIRDSNCQTSSHNIEH
ncbi:hypothetical protein ACRALDRAFT_2015079 [Sodiomyces alcalophilus JCM 7366]|uniref:uncharacterized protein n=1 Tax=Sodiomyces alcalophilus JCM 7366 TaxID=591952 RepID=UPI0039B522A0